MIVFLNEIIEISVLSILKDEVKVMLTYNKIIELNNIVLLSIFQTIYIPSEFTVCFYFTFNHILALRRTFCFEFVKKSSFVYDLSRQFSVLVFLIAQINCAKGT